MKDLKQWVVKLARRLMALPAGEYVIFLTKNDNDRPAWQVIRLNDVKVEKP